MGAVVIVAGQYTVLWGKGRELGGAAAADGDEAMGGAAVGVNKVGGGRPHRELACVCSAADHHQVAPDPESRV